MVRSDNSPEASNGVPGLQTTEEQPSLLVDLAGQDGALSADGGWGLYGIKFEGAYLKRSGKSSGRAPMTVLTDDQANAKIVPCKVELSNAQTDVTSCSCYECNIKDFAPS